MHEETGRQSLRWWSVAGAALALLLVQPWAVGCGSDVSTGGGSSTGGGIITGGGNTTGGGGSGGSGASAGFGGSGGVNVVGCSSPAERVDLLLSIDNSRSMADKQEILTLAVPQLVQRIVNPPCVDPEGVEVPVSSALDECPVGTERQFPPVLDLHVGIISSSLGDHGGDVCPDDSPTNTNDERAHLIARDVNGTDLSAQTYQGLGFLAWDPAAQLSPPGEPNIDALIATINQLVVGVGERGCGFESTLESWYRFLIDPDPYESIEQVGDVAVMEGTDHGLLQQRRDFLRPDSLLLIVMLSDENDCSIRDGGQFFFAAKSQEGAGSYHLPRAQITCATDPGDPCCRSCGQSDDGCPPKGLECATAHDNLSDQINLRCFDQKRRYGIDFLWPIERYAMGLYLPTVQDRFGDLVPNPLYVDLDPSDDITAIREPGLVFVSSIVGVPWQDLARQDASGLPDLQAGLDSNGAPLGGFRTAQELVDAAAWPVIIGHPELYTPPADPHMVESVDPRSGVHPYTGDAIAPPGSPYMANPINGHEYTISERNDLQYACVFPLDEPRDCGASPTPTACDCLDPGNDNPLCQEPGGAYGQVQYHAKIYPGIRQLWLLRWIGDQGITGTVCPAQLGDPSAADFGYQPSAQAIARRIQYCL